MAIKIGNTTVIDDARNLTNLGSSVDSVAGSLNLYQTPTGVTAFSSASSLSISALTISQTLNLATGATASTYTKTINLGTGGLSGSTTNMNIGSAIAGTTTIASPNINLGTASSSSIQSGSPTVSFITTGTTSLTIGSSATTINFGNASNPQTISIGSASTGASTYNFGTGGTTTGLTKTVNIGSGAASGSTTNINIGSVNGGTTTISSPMTAVSTITGTSANFSSSITSPTFIGNATTASIATNANNVATSSQSGSSPISVGLALSTPYSAIGYNTGFQYTPSTNTVTVGSVSLSNSLSVSGTTTLAGGVTGATKINDAVIGFKFSVSQPVSTTYFKIATLPISTSGTYDQLLINGSFNTGGWQATGNNVLSCELGNRAGFNYKHSWMGDVSSGCGISAYQESDNSVSVYAFFKSGQFTAASFSITNSLQVNVFESPASTTSPTGTLVFDSTNGGVYPPLLVLPYTGTSPSYKGAVIWTSGNDGPGSGLNADILDGLSPTSSNTNNTIVSRDGSGNFSAGTITASLTGNATTATTATNLSGGTVNATSGTFSVGLTVTGGGSTPANFYTSGSVGVNTRAGSLAAFSPTGSGIAACMTFLRSSAYGINMGLDTDNTFRLGGWSDGTNVYRLQIDSTGNAIIRGDLTVSGGTVTASTFTGNSATSTLATNANGVSTTLLSTSTNYSIAMALGNPYGGIGYAPNLVFNPGTGTLLTTNYTGATLTLSGAGTISGKLQINNGAYTARTDLGSGLSTITPNGNSSNMQSASCTTAASVALPTNLSDGQTMILIISNTGGSPVTITFNSGYRMPSGTKSFSLTNGQQLLASLANSAGVYYANAGANYS